VGDKVFVTTATSDKQKRPTSAFGGGGFGGGFGGGGPGAYPKGGFGNQKPPDDVFQFQVYCLSAADGKVVWKKTAMERKPTIPKFTSNSYATETPVTDGERVYAYFAMHGLYCYDLAGKEVWKADLGSYPMAMGFGTGSSPALADGKLFVQCDNERESFLVALDAKTGKEVWKTKRSERTGYSTPLVWKTKDRTEVVCLGSQKARAYDAATGKQVWELSGLSGQPKASPVATADVLFVGTGGGGGGFGMGGPGGGGGRPGGGAPGGPKGGFGGGGGGGSKPLFAVKAGASGDITLKGGAKSSDAVAWSLPQAGPGTASPLVYDGRLYVLEDRGGLLSCHDATTGKQLYKERIPGARGFTASPWAYDGKVFCLDDSGATHVIQAGSEFKVLGKNVLDGMCWASPAVAGGAVYLRTAADLYCIRASSKKE
jgi:outer membrane protein assembly factor BamB